MSEQIKQTHEQQANEAKLSAEYRELHEQLEQKRSHEVEKGSPEKNVETRTHEALTEAEKTKEQNPAKQLEAQPERRTRPLSRKELDHAFDAQMSGARLHMSPAARTFSKVIHNRTVEKVSGIAGSTVARPNAILSGSIFAFISVLGVYLIAKYFGYALSGSETMLSFLLGWLVGLVYDYIRVTTRGRSF